MIPTLPAARLILRPFAARDIAPFVALHASAHARLMWVFANREAAWERFLALTGAWGPLGSGAWTIADRWSDAYLGHTGFYHASPEAAPELYWALTEAAQGKGLAQEAVEAARGWGRLNGLARPLSHIDAQNLRSIRLAERLGAVLEARTEFAPGAVALHYRHGATA